MGNLLVHHSISDQWKYSVRFKDLCAPAEKKKPYRANIASPTAHSSKRLTCTQADQEAYVLYIQVSRKDFSNGLSKNYRKHSHSDRGIIRSLKYWLHRQLSPLDSWILIISLPMSGHPENPAHSRTYGVLQQHLSQTEIWVVQMSLQPILEQIGKSVINN